MENTAAAGWLQTVKETIIRPLAGPDGMAWRETNVFIQQNHK